MTKSRFLLTFIVLIISLVFLFPYLKILREYVELKMTEKRTVSDRLSEYGPIVDQRLFPLFQRKNIQYPPNEIVFIALKNEKIFEVYANNPNEKFKKI